ncbi:MAG: retroviral-like aspartic protease family protein [Fibromonadaceae bacterium]|jgi:predicted aspartyl protease|nr:retroviral-like aspartic protease family protein [Fibromonadaceae bacterium]
MSKNSFAIDYDSEIGEIIVNVSAFNQKTGIGTNLKALWDTGANCCVISETIAKRLKLPNIAEVQMKHANGIAIVKTHMLSLMLPNNILFKDIRAMSCKPIHSFDMIIGMNVISKGNMSIVHNKAGIKFSFKYPPTRTK